MFKNQFKFNKTSFALGCAFGTGIYFFAIKAEEFFYNRKLNKLAHRNDVSGKTDEMIDEACK